ncbi:hypothetical protein [Demequina sp. TTPB684]|uniref:hypothetical protein n=1 Tax=Demequina sp. TTPB684 TaxID=2881057 RepID=UPI001CF421AD|nr:hypothetical protein [Demequina sp. TTPB684]
MQRIGSHGPLHEYGAGLGYVARLLSDTGTDIVASDPDPTGNATGHGGGEPWFQVRQGGYGDELDDRMPLLVWPFQNAPHAWLAQPRRPPRLIVVDGRPDPYHEFNNVAPSLISFYEVLEEWSTNAGWRQTPDFVRLWGRR